MTGQNTVSEKHVRPEVVTLTTAQTTAARPAVVLVNLGTPASPEPRDIRAFLREFLSDRRVVETSPWIWRPILEAIILPLRPRTIAEKYRSIWMEGGSPLKVWTERQGEQLRRRLVEDVDVRVAWRYGSPSILDTLDDLMARGHRRVLLVPAYPQYSASTVGSIDDEVARWLLRSRNHMEVRTIRSYEDSSAYIEALATKLEEHWDRAGRPDFAAGDRVIASFHSIPVAMEEGGDPYRQECETTVALLRARLDLPESAMLTTYQSVFGRAEWIGPATIDTIEELGRAGTGRVDVICPGFMADCLETLEEIDQLNHEAFIEAGGGEFHYLPWANDSRGAVDTLEVEARRGLAGWLT